MAVKSIRVLDLEAERRVAKRELDAVQADAFRFGQMYPSARLERALFEKRVQELNRRLKEIEKELADEQQRVDA